MSLVSFQKLADRAIREKRLLWYFESWDQYSLSAVIGSAEEENSPVIVGFGGVMMNQEWFAEKGLEELSAMGRKAVEKAKVDVAYILNEATEFKQVIMGIENGFNMVMMDTGNLPLKENIKITKRIVNLAHRNKVAVEAELGVLPEGRNIISSDFMTDPEKAELFVRETGIDALSVSVGNAHVVTKGKSKLDFARLNEIKERVKIPLVLHGGSGISRQDLARCRDCGVVKINVGTILKTAYFNGIREGIRKNANYKDIHAVVGSRKDRDVLTYAKKRVKIAIKHILRYSL